MPLDWNQINQDDSSVSGYESTHDDDNLPEPQTMKNLSLSTTPKSLAEKLSSNDVIAQNLHKLSIIDTQQVWLFVPKPYKNDGNDNFASFLKGHQKIKKVIPNSAGWNILVNKKQEAKQLILNGYKKDKLTLRFYVSTKNNEFNPQNQSRKGSKESLDENKSFETPHKLRKIYHEEQNSKKKIKYQEKVSDKKLPPRQRSVEKVIKDQIMQDVAKQSLKNEKITQKQNQQQRSSEIQEINENVKEIKIKGEEQNSATDSADKTESEDDKKMKPEFQVSSPEQQGDDQYDSQESLERMRKAIKRKNKKLNKKKTGSKQTDPVDKNNPFSLLA